ncbi:hypothetical protein GCM10010471_01200 [Leucobacter komagatae]
MPESSMSWCSCTGSVVGIEAMITLPANSRVDAAATQSRAAAARSSSGGGGGGVVGAVDVGAGGAVAGSAAHPISPAARAALAARSVAARRGRARERDRIPRF